MEIRILEQATHEHHSHRKLSVDELDILSYVKEFKSINLAEAESVLPKLSRRSVQRKLSTLVSGGYLELVGATRDAHYILKKTRI